MVGLSGVRHRSIPFEKPNATGYMLRRAESLARRRFLFWGQGLSGTFRPDQVTLMEGD